MNRVWDYIGFAVWFAGLGYIVMWLFGTPGQRSVLARRACTAVGVASAIVRVAGCMRSVCCARSRAAQARRGDHSGSRRECPQRRSAAAAAKAGVAAARSNRAVISACAACRD